MDFDTMVHITALLKTIGEPKLAPLKYQTSGFDSQTMRPHSFFIVLLRLPKLPRPCPKLPGPRPKLPRPRPKLPGPLPKLSRPQWATLGKVWTTLGEVWANLHMFKKNRGRTDRPTDRPTDGWTDGPTDGRTDGWTDGRTHPLIEMRGRI